MAVEHWSQLLSNDCIAASITMGNPYFFGFWFLI